MHTLRRVMNGSSCRDSTTSLILLRSFSTRTPRKSKSKSKSQSQSLSPKPFDNIPFQPKPSEIPFQPKLANAVNLIGQVHSPVHFQTSPDGNAWAATVITRPDSPSSPSLSVPLVFEGDLAHTAFCHLKPNDSIHIAGKLSTDPPHFQCDNPPGATIQVMVHSLNFVKGYSQLNDISATSTNQLFSFPSNTSEKGEVNPSWKHNDAKQNEEFDWQRRNVPSTKDDPKGAAFERKTNGELLFIDSSTLKCLQEKLESKTIDLKPELKHSTTGTKKVPNSSLYSWNDLLDDPKQWFDFRDSKVNGLVNPRHPDFKRKDGSGSLWLGRSPTWVLSKLEGLEFDVPVVKSKQTKDLKGDQSWNDLVQNPAKWWDNRLNKRNERAPDFKHKETGVALWLDGSPSWVLSKLPPPKPKQSFGKTSA